MEEAQHNTYASAQVGRANPSSAVREQADRQIQALKAELMNLAAQSRQLCSDYVKEKRDGYIQMSFDKPPVLFRAVIALFMTGLFLIAWSGKAILEPFWRQYRGERTAPREKRQESENREEAKA